ncbi:MAG: protein kinase [Gemmatimonadetes bacterium]|nr:protein kinase [Gemmatimonadota bacterium]
MSDVLRERVTAALSDAYDVGREVGRGGMGVVYRATDRKLRREVAIKVLPPELAYREDVKQRFLREAQTAAQLSHANIVPIYAVEERDGLVCFVMALVDGESLASRIARERHLSPEFTADTLRAVADALGYAHGRGIVHRDIKPDNILLDRHSGRPMVTDFGIARAAEGDARLTVTGIAVGTPAYMSPEQAMGEKEIDGRSDLYSLAVVGYHMLCGELPFHASNTPAMLMKHISETPRPIRAQRPDAPAWLTGILECAMAKKPADRFASAHAFRDALVRREGPAPADAPEAPAPPPAPWKHAVPRDAVEVARVRLPRVSRQATEQPPARSAIEAANPGWSTRDGGPARPPVPAWMPASWRDARQGWQGPAAKGRQGRGEALDQLPVIEKIRRFRRRATSTVTTLAFLTVINLVFSPGFFWVMFPAFGMLMGLLRHWGSLRDDGVQWADVYGPKAREALARNAEQRGRLRAGVPADGASSLAPPDVLAGPHGTAIRRAADDRETLRDAVARLGKADRELIPDVLPTVDALVERIASLAGALHRIDADTQPHAMAEAAARIEAARALPEGRDRDQRVQLLERQLVTMKDLASRRETLASQLESASLMLQGMRLDLVALRSAGVQSAMNDVSSATQEARALSREIANVLDAAKEVR